MFIWLTHFHLQLLPAVITLDLLLSGDNAVVVALVCAGLPPRQRSAGIYLGLAGAVAMRLLMVLCAAWLLTVPYLRLAGGVFLLWVAYGMLRAEDDEEAGRRQARSLWGAALLVAVADASMSLDNVMALAALAQGSVPVLVAGVLLAVPLVVLGARAVSYVVARTPWLVWAGAALLGWVAAGLALGDPALLRVWQPDAVAGYAVRAVCAAGVVAAGWLAGRITGEPQDA